MDINKLKSHIPDSVLTQIPEVMDKYKINTVLRLSHFLAQCGHESGNFKATVENLNYSSKGLLTVFKKYFPSELLAGKYQRQPEKIANRVYASRMGNGDENSGDGWKFRGRGFIQLTGKTNYESFNKLVPENILTSPDLVATKYPLLSAAWFWDSRSLNSIADKGSDKQTITDITKKINGGTHGLDDRILRFNKFFGILS
jgi:putative chitinase